MKRNKAFTLVEVMISMAILIIALGIILSLTKSSSAIFQSGLRRFDYANQARQLNTRLTRDCTGPTYWQILGDFTGRTNGVGSSGTCLVLAYTNNLNNIVPTTRQNSAYAGSSGAGTLGITRVVCYYLDTSGAATADYRMLRRIDSAAPRAGVTWPFAFATSPKQLTANTSLASLLPTASGMAAGEAIGQVHIAQGNLASAPKYQLFYSQSSAAVSVNFLLRYGNDYESFIAPFQLTTPILR